MDTSKKYVLMCEKAVEIQLRKYQSGFVEGDYIWDGKKACFLGMDLLVVKQGFVDGHCRIIFAMLEPMQAISFEQGAPMSPIEVKTGAYNITTFYNPLWLPRQDQLIDMLVGVGDYYYNALLPLYNWTRGGPAPDDWRTKDSRNFTSMEQLWLAFVMKELYSKTWTGSEWESC